MPCLLPSDPIVKPLASAVRGEDGDCVAEAGEYVTELHLQHRVLAPGLVRGREDRALAHLCCGVALLAAGDEERSVAAALSRRRGAHGGGVSEGGGAGTAFSAKEGHNREASHFIPCRRCRVRRGAAKTAWHAVCFQQRRQIRDGRPVAAAEDNASRLRCDRFSSAALAGRSCEARQRGFCCSCISVRSECGGDKSPCNADTKSRNGR